MRKYPSHAPLPQPPADLGLAAETGPESSDSSCLFRPYCDATWGGGASSQADGFAPGPPARSPWGLQAQVLLTAPGTTGIPAISLPPSRTRAWPVPRATRPRSKMVLERFPNTDAMSASLVSAALAWNATVRSRDRGITHVSVSLPPGAVSRRWLLKGSAVRRPLFANCRTAHHPACAGPMGGGVGRHRACTRGLGNDKSRTRNRTSDQDFQPPTRRSETATAVVSRKHRFWLMAPACSQIMRSVWPSPPAKRYLRHPCLALLRCPVNKHHPGSYSHMAPLRR